MLVPYRNLVDDIYPPGGLSFWQQVSVHMWHDMCEIRFRFHTTAQLLWWDVSNSGQSIFFSNTCSGLMWLSFPFTQFLVDCKLLYIRMNPVDILAAWKHLTRCVAPDCFLCHFFVPTLPIRWYHAPTLAVSLAVACPIFFLMRNKSSQMIWHPLRTT